MSVNGVEIKVGQKWKTRGGEVVHIWSWSGWRSILWVCSNKQVYTDLGRVCEVSDPRDLVELIQDVPGPDDFGYESPAPVPQAVELNTFPDIAEHDRAVGAVKLSDCYLPKEKQVCAPDLLDAAAGHMRNRAATYDKPEGERSMVQTVAIFNLHHGVELTEAQGWHFMQILKDVRLFTNPDKPHRDSVDDCIAYAALKGEAMLKGGAQ